MSDVDAQPRSPFAGVPTRDVVRDVVAVVALVVALPLPWDLQHRGSDLLWVVLTTVLALLVVAAPYAQRAGVLTDGWTRLAEPRTRLIGLAPYGLVALLYVVLDVFAVGGGRIGAGLALGLAGAVLAASLPTARGVVASAAVVAIAAVATPLVSVLEDASWPLVLGAVLAALLVLTILWRTAWAFWGGEEAAGVVLVAIGGAIALELALLGGGTQHPWLESLHSNRYGLLLLPVVAAFAVPAVVGRSVAVAGEPVETSAARWVRVAVRSFELMIAVAAFVALVAVVQLIAVGAGVSGFGIGVEPVLRLIIGVLVVVVAFFARRALLRDAQAAHATAVGAACVVVVLGIVILVARAGVGTRSHVEELLLALALPAIVLAALLVPPSVRVMVDAHASAAASAASAVSAASAASAASSVSATSAAGSATGVGSATGAGSAASWHAEEAPVDATASLDPVVSSPGGEGSRWRGTWAAGTDATQQMAPVEASDQPRPAQPTQPTQPTQYQGGRPDETQRLAPVTDDPGARWTPEVALDPTTPLADLALIVQEAPHLRPHVAANPSTYPALLDWLGALGDPAVDAALRTRR